MKIAVCGYGKAGKTLIKKILSSSEYELVGVICRRDSKNAGVDVGTIVYEDNHKIGIPIMKIDDVETKLKESGVEAIIDFSNRNMSLPLLEICKKIHSNLVICTTNHTADEIGKFEQIAEHEKIGIVYAPNLTIGINLILDFVKKISNVFNAFSYEVIERHPKNKPIPTATSRIITQTIGQDDIPIHSMRLDGYVGIHEIVATDGVERITITHESLSREAFANGALAAVDYIKDKQGLFFMKDVIYELSK